MTSNLFFGSAPLNLKAADVALKTVTIDGESTFKIEHYDRMTPFFMTVVSDVDHWMFISSTGGLTCGRKNPDNALFPYETDDKIHDSAETTGSNTILIVTKNNRHYVWKPFSTHHCNVYDITRNLYKNTIGNKIRFEEINDDLGVAFSTSWKNSDVYGFIKTSEVRNLSNDVMTVRVLDGIRNILPYGINTNLQTSLSTLLDGYKRCELVNDVGLGIYTLSSILSDRAEPSESLKATTVWSKGLDHPTILLSEQQLSTFETHQPVSEETDVKGRRGSYYVVSELCLNANSAKDWVIAAELNQGPSQVIARVKSLKDDQDLIAKINADIAKGDANLKRLVFNADGLQVSANQKVSNRHFSNTLYNIMRGGVYANDYWIDRDDFAAFVQVWNKPIHAQYHDFITALPATIRHDALLTQVEALNAPDFERLVLEYLPLTYSRRHGDPSRPWNRFSIELVKEDGSRKLNFEGNWRDIFQNWEALSISYPDFTESIIAKFVNASTADGYNPYRITKSGMDWEAPNPLDPWSNIGYWGDHQIIYLLKLMELSKAYNPTKLHDYLHKPLFVYANVPYRIKGFKALMENPHNSIDYDHDLDEKIEALTQQIGADGKLIHANGTTVKVNLLEKLLVTMLAKLTNYVPEGGIWMNTQRPEWNDANNALVGNGLSMVTLYYLHRYQRFLQSLIQESGLTSIELSTEVLHLFQQTDKVLSSSAHRLGKPISDTDRFEMVQALGQIGETYRNTVYTQGFIGEKATLSVAQLNAFLTTSLAHLNDSIHKNKRPDGLYHAYNLIKFDNQACSLSHLYEMLEGQVAVLSSKALSAQETLSVLSALRTSPIYRADQDSYMLYPNRELPKFLDKNIIPKEQVNASPILLNELKLKRTRFIEVDVNGNYHFNGTFRNGADIEYALKATGEYKAEDIRHVKNLYADLFNHHAFTGRSGTFYKYEGLGSIYWHMVSKLALATQESFMDSFNAHGLDTQAKALREAYRITKAGIGIEKSPALYGAFPTDAYSHTPSFAGVQQPGLTGQVKEDIIARFTELGVLVNDGRVHFDPVLLDHAEFLSQAQTWTLPRPTGLTSTFTLKPNSLAFTFGTVPVIYTLSDKSHITVHFTNGSHTEFTDTLDTDTSRSLFVRDGKIDYIEVQVKV